MREFQDYTKEPRAARFRWWLWSLPVVLAGLILLAGAIVMPAEEPGSGVEPGPERVEASPAGWIEKMLGGEGGPGGPLNVLVLGVDKRPPDSKEAQVVGTRTDTIMLVRLVPETGEVSLLSIPRDLLVEVKPGVEDRINAAYTYGGFERTVAAVEDYAAVPVNHYAIVDFEGFEAVIDAIGGVEVRVEDDFPPKRRIGEGLEKLDGRQALFYARYRGTACGDLDRIRRQQQLVAALRSKALRWNTVKKLPEIAKVMNENVKTDVGLEQSVSLGRVLINRGLNARMTSNQLKGTPETLPNVDEVLIPNERANERILAIFRGDNPPATVGHQAKPSPDRSSRCE